MLYHGLHSSAGTVLTAVTLSYRKWRNSTPRRIKTPSLVEMKLRTYDYVREICVEFYLYPTVGTVLIHSVKPKLTE